MKVMTVIIYIFSGVAFVLLTTAFFLYQSTQSFLESAIVANGEVIELVRRNSTNSSSTYSPRIHFKTQSGETIEFTSSSSSNPASYSKGEKVEILYLPSNPKDARINGFFSLWGLEAIFGGIGLVFLLVLMAIIVFPWLSRRKEKYLRRHGIAIITNFQKVELNTRLTINEKNPFHVLTEWKDPATAEEYIFTSQNLWSDPTEEMTKKNITVFIKKGNPKKYFMDLSFLSKS